MKFLSAVFISLAFASISRGQSPSAKATFENARILPGAEQMDLYLPLLQNKSVAIFANQTSVVGSTHLVDTLLKRGIKVKKIFAPEHGFRGSADAGEHVDNVKDLNTGIPVISLYGNKQKPDPEDLTGIDILVFDIQDVGVRFYTYISSLQKYVEAAIENKLPLIILDRPDPNGFYVDGPVLETKFKSFVGMQPIPVVYGMTMGEYAKMLVGENWLDLQKSVQAGWAGFKLVVIPCKNYSHRSHYQLPVKPSPNLPNMNAVYLYPSLCFFEGTAVSLGRGTDQPFQLFGHPSFPDSLFSFVPVPTAGAKNPPLLNQRCYGFDLSKQNMQGPSNVHLELKWILEAYLLFGDKEHFFLSSGAYFSKLAGTDDLRQQIISGKTESEIRNIWEPGLRQFKKIRKKYLLYTDFE